MRRSAELHISQFFLLKKILNKRQHKSFMKNFWKSWLNPHSTLQKIHNEKCLKNRNESEKLRRTINKSPKMRRGRKSHKKIFLSKCLNSNNHEFILDRNRCMLTLIHKEPTMVFGLDFSGTQDDVFLICIRFQMVILKWFPNHS